MAEDGRPTPERYPVISPPLLFILCLGAAALAQFLEPMVIVRYADETGRIAGAALIAAGGALAGWGIWTMLANRTPIEPGHIPSRLVVVGPFRYTRNPLYIGLTTVALGIAVMIDSLWFIAAAVILFILIDRIVVPREEAAIRRTFGAEYEAYLARVRRWL